MGSPTLPSLVALVFGSKPALIPLRHTGGWGVVIPAGHPAYILSPSVSPRSDRHSRTEIASMLRSAASTDHPWFSYDLWSIQVTPGAWAQLESVQDALVEVLASPRILVLDQGSPSVWTRLRRLCRSIARRLLDTLRQAPADTLTDRPSSREHATHTQHARPHRPVSPPPAVDTGDPLRMGGGPR